MRCNGRGGRVLLGVIATSKAPADVKTTFLDTYEQHQKSASSRIFSIDQPFNLQPPREAEYQKSLASGHIHYRGLLIGKSSFHCHEFEFEYKFKLNTTKKQEPRLVDLNVLILRNRGCREKGPIKLRGAVDTLHNLLALGAL